MYTCTSPPQRQVLKSNIALWFSSCSLCIALPCTPQRSHVACFTVKLAICEGQGLRETTKRRSRAQPAAHSPPIDFYGPSRESE